MPDEEKPLWVKSPQHGSDDYVLWVQDEPELCWRDARVRRDGCMEFTRYFNSPRPWQPQNREEFDSIHICDIDEFIEQLQALRAAAKAHFGEHWNED